MSDISIYGYTDIGGRKENEDSGDIRIYGKNLVAVIADGLSAVCLRAAVKKDSRERKK